MKRLKFPPLKTWRYDRVAFYGVIGVIAVVIGGYATWRLISLISPEQLNEGGSAAVDLRVSDHYLNSGGAKVLLPDSATDPTQPYYDDNIESGPTPFGPEQNGQYSLFRIQGEIEYQ